MGRLAQTLGVTKIMPTTLRVAMVSPNQVEVGRKLGIDLTARTVRVASAMIGEYLMLNFWGATEGTSPSTRQCELAEEFGYDIKNMSRGVGSAIIDDIMDHLNTETIERESLEPGVRVRFRGRDDEKVRVISSISPDGTVFFKGGNGQKAWARSLERLKSDA